MLAWILRSGAFAVVILVSLLAGLQLQETQRTFPLGTDETLTLSFNSSSISKAQAIDGMNRIATDHALTLVKKNADRDDFLHGLSLYQFGDRAPAEPANIDWFDSSMHGQLFSSSQIAQTSLDGSYAVVGPEAGVSALQSFLADSGVQVDATRAGWLDTAAALVVGKGAGLALVSGLVLMTTVVMAWSALHSRARALHILAGVSTPRILRTELRSLAGLLVIPALAGIAAAGVYVFFSRGGSAVTDYFRTLTPWLAGLVAVLVIGSVVVTALSWPSVDTIAHRRPPARAYRVFSEVLKVAALVLVVASLPPLVSAISAATNATADNARWSNLGNEVGLRMTNISDEERLAAVLPRFVTLTRDLDERHDVAVSYAFDPATVQAGQYDDVVLVNPRYLELQHVTALSPVEAGDLPAVTRSDLKANMPLWTKGTAAAADPLSAASYATIRPGTGPVQALSPNAGRSVTLDRPLFVIVNRPADVFGGSFLLSLMSTSNLIFSSDSQLTSQLTDHQLDGYVLSIDRVSDTGLYQSQIDNQDAALRTISIVLLSGSLIISAMLSALVYALSRARPIFALRTSGSSWPRLLRERLLIDIATGTGLTLIAAFLLGVDRASHASVLLIVPVAYAALTVTLHCLAARSVFGRTLTRST
ncbi:hypothetical protein V6N00_08160 [Tersicoccus sp. MR15.9]|uniref:hypothetical protein n=1 Tax=Tersicoccus mangrovi TaxID=3121635 RepID=UPI002FE5266D